MRCPYCAEDIKDDAIVCKHCHRELFVIKPLLDKIDELGARLASPNETMSHAEADAISHARHAPARHHRWGLSALESCALAYITHVVLHFLINVQFDLRLGYFIASSIVVPMVFGFLWRGTEKKLLGVGLLLGLVVAVAAIPSELAVISAVEKVPFRPKDAYEWRDLAFHSASIATAFLTGVIARHMILATFLPAAKADKTIEWITRFIVDQFFDGKPKFTLKAIRSMVSSILGVVSAMISIVTGLWEYLLK